MLALPNRARHARAVQTPGDQWNRIQDALHLRAADADPVGRHLQWIREHAHTHAYAEMALCLRGEHAYGVDGRLVRARPGAVWLLPCGVAHDGWYGPFHQPCLDLWVHFFPRGFATMNLAEHDPVQGVALRALPWPAADLDGPTREAADRMTMEDAAHRGVGRATGFCLLYLAARLIEVLKTGPALRTEPEHGEVLAEIKGYIRGNLADDLRLKDLAKLAGYSPFHFHRLFRQAEGRTLRRYVEDCRLEYARRLLEKGLSVTAAGLESGFSSAGEFSRVFRRAVGMAPTRWLSRLAQEQEIGGKNCEA